MVVANPSPANTGIRRCMYEAHFPIHAIVVLLQHNTCQLNPTAVPVCTINSHYEVVESLLSHFTPRETEFLVSPTMMPGSSGSKRWNFQLFASNLFRHVDMLFCHTCVAFLISNMSKTAETATQEKEMHLLSVCPNWVIIPRSIVELYWYTDISAHTNYSRLL